MQIVYMTKQVNICHNFANSLYRCKNNCYT